MDYVDRFEASTPPVPTWGDRDAPHYRTTRNVATHLLLRESTTLGSLRLAVELARGITLLVSAQGDLVAASAAASSLLDEQRGLRRQAGQVGPTEPSEQRQFRQALVETIAAGPRTLLVRRARDLSPLVVDLYPCGQEVNRVRYVAIDVIDFDAPLHQASQRLGHLFSLSEREIEVATWLAQGQGVAEIGERMGITKETVRSHLKQVFEKTGTNRQTQLVRLVLLSAR